jgi:REP element-mobilizing transposase RayT
LASHVIFTAYGFWLPNDPRGSWSEFVGAWELFKFGPATKTDTRRSVAGERHDPNLRRAAKAALQRAAVNFDGRQARAIGRGFATACADAGYVFRECSILPDHVHGVIDRHERPVERIVGHLKAAATRQLRAEGLHPFEGSGDERVPTVWAENCWKVFLNEGDSIVRAMDYVRGNPGKEGLREQKWSFVKQS